MTEWKQVHADAAEKSCQHDLVTDVIAEYLGNMGLSDDGLPAFGIRKVAHYAATVARAEALGFDPNLLRLTPTEANSHILDLAARAVIAGVPTWTLGGNEEAR